MATTKKAAATKRARTAKDVKAEAKKSDTAPAATKRRSGSSSAEAASATSSGKKVAGTPKATATKTAGRVLAAKASEAPFEGGVPAAKPAKPAKLPKLKIPKSLGACADLLKLLESQRLAAEKLITPMKAQEVELRNHIINNLPKSQLGGAAGKLYRAEIKKKQVPQVADWAKLQAHIKKTGDFDLLGRGINAKAVAERWENRKKIPGVEAFEVVSLSVTKL